MSEQLLHVLGWQLTPTVLRAVDAPAREVVPEGVQGILRLAVLVHYPGGHHHRCETAQHVGVVLNLALRGREYQPVLALWARKLPFLQRADHARPQVDDAYTRFRLRPADNAIAVRTLVHVQ